MKCIIEIKNDTNDKTVSDIMCHIRNSLRIYENNIKSIILINTKL